MASVPRQKTSVLWMLDWLRKRPAISAALLKDVTEVGFRVQMFVVLSNEFAKKFEKNARKALRPSRGQLDEQRRRLVGELLRRELREGPDLLDVELPVHEHGREEREDFEEEDGFLKTPKTVFIDFKMKRKMVAAKGRKTATADNPASDAGGPGYVEKFTDPGIPEWLKWRPNPNYPAVEKLVEDLMPLLRPGRPTLKEIVAALNTRGHRTLKGAVFTEQNVDRAVVAAELVLGNEEPATEN